MAYMDFQFGRVLDALRETGELDNTLILYVQGDNGAAIHELAGSMNAYEGFAQIESTDEELTARIDDAGGEDSFRQLSGGLGPLRSTRRSPGVRRFASHLGGTRNALAVSWPARIAERGAIRPQYTHVIDLAPTIYEAIGITPPEVVDGVEQQPIDGVSFAHSFTDGQAPSEHTEQYYEMLGSRGFYKDGWLAATGVTWDPWRIPDYDPASLPWELYNLDVDYSQVHNIASQHPGKLAELQADFDAAAQRYNVYPLASDYLARLSPSNRPHAVEPSDSYTYYPGDARYPIAAWPNVTPNWEATAKLTTNSADDSGPGVRHGHALHRLPAGARRRRSGLHLRPDRARGRAHDRACTIAARAG